MELGSSPESMVSDQKINAVSYGKVANVMWTETHSDDACAALSALLSAAFSRHTSHGNTRVLADRQVVIGYANRGLFSGVKYKLARNHCGLPDDEIELLFHQIALLS